MFASVPFIIRGNGKNVGHGCNLPLAAVSRHEERSHALTHNHCVYGTKYVLVGGPCLCYLQRLAASVIFTLNPRQVQRTSLKVHPVVILSNIASWLQDPNCSMLGDNRQYRVRLITAPPKLPL
jgi:hypothetical protein